MNQIAPIHRANAGISVILPQSIDEVWRLAGIAWQGGMAPKSLIEGKAPEEAQAACAVAIMAGAELGLTPLMALRSYAVVNGRPSLWGDGIKAVVRQSGRCEYIKAGGDLEKGWCEAKRSDTGEVMRREFTWEQAKKANLTTKKGPWQEHPDMMMERRATSRCLNDLFADVLGGVVTYDEAAESEVIEEAPQQIVAPPPPPQAAEVEDATDIEPEASFDTAAFLENLLVSLSTAKTEEELYELWDEHDVEATLTEYEDALQDAFDMRKDRLEAINAAEAFPGDK